MIDAFPGFNEIQLAEFRIRYLSELVDRVVIAESNLTQSGLEKKLYFQDWLENQTVDLQKRIEILRVPLEKQQTSWEREIFTREFLMDHLRDYYPNARFILSDLDEIPSKNQVEKLRQSDGIFHFHTPTFFRKINWQLKDQHLFWARGVMGQVSMAQYPNGGRFTKTFPWIEASPGGHFSWLGIDQNSIAKKSQAAAHEELNDNYWSSKMFIDFCDRYRIDHLGRGRSIGFGLFHVIYPLPVGLLTELSIPLPQLVDSCETLPNFLSRFWASIKVTAYVGETKLSKMTRKKYQIEYFLASKNLTIYFLVLIELLFSLAAIIKRRMKNLLGHAGFKLKRLRSFVKLPPILI